MQYALVFVIHQSRNYQIMVRNCCAQPFPKIMLRFLCSCLLFLVFFSVTISHCDSTTYCPPLGSPPKTNLSCLTAPDNQLVDCASTWLPDGSLAYFRCTDDDLSVRFGKIVCDGNYEINNDEPSEIKKNQEVGDLPCGIRPMPTNFEFHFYSFEKAQHFPVLMNVSEDVDFRTSGLELLNSFRKQHQADPLEIDELLNEKAQLWADTLAQRNSLDLATENFVGQNVFNSDQSQLSLAVNDALQYWYSAGLATYNWDDLKTNWDNPLALDFSQIVWKSTRKLGLGASNRKYPVQKGSLVVAFYFPMGNIVLEKDSQPDKMFLENVLKSPYNSSSDTS